MQSGRFSGFASSPSWFLQHWRAEGRRPTGRSAELGAGSSGLVVDNGYLGSVIARRHRPSVLHCYHAPAILPPAFVKVVLAVLDPKHKFGIALFHWVLVERESIRVHNGLAVCASEQYICCRLDIFDSVLAGRESAARDPELKWDRCLGGPLFLCHAPACRNHKDQ